MLWTRRGQATTTKGSPAGGGAKEVPLGARRQAAGWSGGGAQEVAGDLAGDVGHAAGVAPLVVVPRVDLHHRALRANPRPPESAPRLDPESRRIDEGALEEAHRGDCN